MLVGGGSLTACGSSGDPGFLPSPTTNVAENYARPTYTAEQVTAARAQCDSPRGATVPFASILHEASLLAGSWLVCPSTDDGGPGQYPLFGPYAGLRFTLGGGIITMVDDADGGVGVPGDGIASLFAAYTLEPFPGEREDDVSGQVTSPYVGGFPAFETTPHRLTFADTSGALVYLGP